MRGLLVLVAACRVARFLPIAAIGLAALTSTTIVGSFERPGSHGLNAHEIALDPSRPKWPIVREPSGYWGVVGEAVAHNGGAHATQIQSVTLTIVNRQGRRVLDKVFDTPDALGAIVKVYRRDDAGNQSWEPSTVLDPGDVGAAFLAELTDPQSVPSQAHVTMQFSQGPARSFAVPLQVFDPGQRMGWPASLENEPWLAVNTAASDFHRVGSAIPSGHRLFVGQRFAIDLVQIDTDGHTHPAWASTKEEYYAWGEEIRSAGRGRVVAVQRNERDLEAGEQPSPLTNPAGNHVVVRHEPDLFSVYAHMQHGSAAVNVGDWVERGQVLGLVGNSGSTSEPHLHVHFTDAWPRGVDPIVSLISSQGVPAVFWGAQVLRDGRLLPLKGATPFEFDVILRRSITP